jgi:hypothetical protein
LPQEVISGCSGRGFQSIAYFRRDRHYVGPTDFQGNIQSTAKRRKPGRILVGRRAPESMMQMSHKKSPIAAARVFDRRHGTEHRHTIRPA